MFFPAFHILDILLGRVRYASTVGKLIAHTRGELLPAWRDLFAAIAESDLRAYCAAHGRACPELMRALVRLQDGYQHFFLVHRRKVFEFEYQGIVTGRNSTNAGISVNIKDRTVESVFTLSTWNEIDELLLESGAERPLEPLSAQPQCPWGLAQDAPKRFPPVVATRCPFSTAPPSEPAISVGAVAELLPDWRPLPTSEGAALSGVELKSLPVPPRVGDRVALWLDSDGRERVEGDFMGPLAPPYAVRTAAPIRALHRVEVLRGVFARMPGAGPRAEQTRESPVLILAQGRHSVLATTLAPHARSEFFVVVEGGEEERSILVARGVADTAICVTCALDGIAADEVSKCCGT